MALVESAESACNARDDKGGFLVAGGGRISPSHLHNVLLLLHLSDW